MQEKLKGFGEKAKNFFVNMSKRTRIVLGCVLGALIIVVVAVIVTLSNQPYAVLFTGLSAGEVSTITTYLNENSVTDFRIEGTDTILVPQAQEDQLKASLLLQGYPKSGFAYETYRAGVGSMSTDSDRQMAYLQDLQDRIGGVIRCFDGVKSAVVTIAQGEDRRYVLDSSNVVEASASVFVTLKDDNTSLTNQQAAAIRSLVAHAVQGLEISKVEISDSLGNTYNSTGDVVDAKNASQLKLQLEEQVDNKIRSNILTVLIPLYGADNVKVAVTSTVDVNHTVGESVDYTLPDWANDGSTGGQGIIGSRVYDQEVIRGDVENPGGLVGNQTNADINTYVENEVGVNGDETYIRNQGETNYNVDTDKQQVERLAGVVTDLMVSVSINSATSGAVNTTELMPVVARAAGITPAAQEEKVAILLSPFYDPNANIVPPPGGLDLPPWAIYAAIGGAVLLVLLLVLLLTIRSKRKKKLRKQMEMEAMMNAMQAVPEAEPVPEIMTPDDGADIMTIKTEKSIQLRQEIRKFTEENPELAAHMLKSWLKGNEGGEEIA